MNRTVLALFGVAAVLVAACSSASSAGEPTSSSGTSGTSATQTASAGGVTVTADWDQAGQSLRFRVALDNHAIDLDSVTLAGASLRNDRGDTLTSGAWDAPAGGGHHRDGYIDFGGGNSTFLAGARWVELTLPAIGSVTEPPLRWEVPAS